MFKEWHQVLEIVGSLESETIIEVVDKILPLLWFHFVFVPIVEMIIVISIASGACIFIVWYINKRF